MSASSMVVMMMPNNWGEARRVPGRSGPFPDQSTSGAESTI